MFGLGYQQAQADSPSVNLPASPAPVAHFGQVIEYIQNRIYLAAYTQAPTDKTPFPYPSTPSHSPTKRSSKQYASAKKSQGPKVHPPCYFTIDDELPYNRFHADFGPLHIGHVYRFSLLLNYLLADPNNEDRALVLWSKPDSRSRANAACLLACYMILVQGWPPHLALAPIAQAEPPVMPFRDAGYSQADFSISIQDILYGIWRAKQEGLCSLDGFKLDEYERFERVDQGDFNWVTPHGFVALASPQHELIDTIPLDSELYESLPKTASGAKRNRNISEPFRNVLVHFSKRNVGLVVRLNSQLYTPSYFTALGINHLDMIFDDGTCPPLSMVKKFIRLAHDMIAVKKKAVGVHCKAGLGRTGCLIGAYLIYRHGFTANEVIAFMRFMRPGMVVGPQQHWLHLNQNQFREWWYEDKFKAKLNAALPATPTKVARRGHVSNGQTATPPNVSSQTSKRSALGEITHNETAINPNVADENLPAPTPGQPRKGSRSDVRHHPYTRAPVSNVVAPSTAREPADQVVEMRSHRKVPGKNPGETEDQWELRVLGRRTSSQSPARSGKKRAVSCTTTTTTTTSTIYDKAGADENMDTVASDVENWVHHDEERPEQTSRPKTLASARSGSGGNILGVAKVRASPARRSGESREVKSGGIRKTSARVGSVGAVGRSRS